MENEATTSLSLVAPTLTADEMQAGSPMALVSPPFPEAITVAIPSERRLSMTAFVAVFALSQLAWEE